MVGLAVAVAVYAVTVWYDCRARSSSRRRIAELENDLEVTRRLADAWRERVDEERKGDDIGRSA